uniref:Cytochrome b6-f complex subunit 6 n=1 Tax=Marsilea crenata TaxID=388472 RepID=S4UFW6_MARCR|nr:cytochrome b6-f complex subunit 6 [Marsilea crenata]AGI51492.1 cytochrome b6-f complex subunit 6 [Marsilea crenata]
MLTLLSYFAFLTSAPIPTPISFVGSNKIELL